jgi:formylglycine-generating enzyme required for sulfatase activity
MRPAVVPDMVGFPATDALFTDRMRPAECTQPKACAGENVESRHVPAFYLDKHEVTNGEFCTWLNTHTGDWLSPAEDGIVKDSWTSRALVWTRSCLHGLTIVVENNRPTVQPTPGSAKRPVTCISWVGAHGYCDAQKKRLPYDFEWKLAAMGRDGRPFPWGTDPPRPGDVAYDTSAAREVGTSRQDRSPEGIYDLAGNVAEWVQSEHDNTDWRQIRGGSFLSKAPCGVLADSCQQLHPLDYGESLGFRCARDADQR